MSDAAIEIIKEGGGITVLGLLLWFAFNQIKAMFNKNTEFIDKQTNALKETQERYTESLMKVVSDYERQSSENNAAMGKLIERIDNISRDIPSIKNTNIALKESIRKTEEMIEVLKRGA